MIEVLLCLSAAANVILFGCLVATMVERNSARDAAERLSHCYERMKADADYWVRESQRLTARLGQTHAPQPQRARDRHSRN